MRFLDGALPALELTIEREGLDYSDGNGAVQANKLRYFEFELTIAITRGGRRSTARLFVGPTEWCRCQPTQPTQPTRPERPAERPAQWTCQQTHGPHNLSTPFVRPVRTATMRRASPGNGAESAPVPIRTKTSSPLPVRICAEGGSFYSVHQSPRHHRYPGLQRRSPNQ
jgi:hypothetical protein